MSADRFIEKKPCASCPYRKDVPVKTWHRSEFENLLAADLPSPVPPGFGEGPRMGATFGCHKYRHRPTEEFRYCAGWVLDQRKRGWPSIMLRLACAKVPGLVDALEAVTDGGLDLYASIKAMALANGVRKAKAKPPGAPGRRTLPLVR